MKWTGLFFANLAALLVTICPARGQNADSAAPVAPRVFTYRADNAALRDVLAELTKQTGLEVDAAGPETGRAVTVDFNRVPFWKALDALADQTGGQIVIGQSGKAVRIIKRPNDGRAPASSDGPFRVSAREVEARCDLGTGATSYDLTLELAWEARLPVYRVDGIPKITRGEDSAGRPVSVKPVATRHPVSGMHTTLRFRVEGLSRDSKNIAVLQGTLRATAAEEMVRFTFNDLTRPATSKQKGVEVVFRKFAKEGTYWVADLELNYPPGGPVFESFETFWVGRNRLTLVGPDGEKFAPGDEEIDGTRVRYRFKEDRAKGLAPAEIKGWKLEYEAPGPMRELPVKFELKVIKLP